MQMKRLFFCLSLNFIIIIYNDLNKQTFPKHIINKIYEVNDFTLHYFLFIVYRCNFSHSNFDRPTIILYFVSIIQRNA